LHKDFDFGKDTNSSSSQTEGSADYKAFSAELLSLISAGNLALLALSLYIATLYLAEN